MVVNKIIGSLVDKRPISGRTKNHLSSTCFLCAGSVSGDCSLLCESCGPDLPVIRSACAACSLPVTAGSLCAHCLSNNNPLIHRTVCPYLYEFPVNRLVQDMKFHGRLEVISIFVQALTEKIISEKIDLPGCLIPTPLHGSRLRERGYNQSALLVKGLSDSLDLPKINNALVRIRKTGVQSELPALFRKRNVKNAFAVNQQLLLPFDHVAIVDDVITTGATAQEMARTIRRAGIKRVDVWVCARTAI